jgi:hypothetical protein
VRNANTQRAEPAQPPYSGEATPFIACAGAERPRLLARDTAIGGDAPERRFWIFAAFVTEGHEPPNACVGVSQWQAGTTVDEVLTAAGTLLRDAEPAGGDAVTTGDVAAGAGRGVAGALS